MKKAAGCLQLQTPRRSATIFLTVKRAYKSSSMPCSIDGQSNPVLCTKLQKTDFLNTAALAFQRRMRIQLQSGFDICVTEHGADTLDICTGFNTSRSERVPKGMEAAMPNTAALQESGELILTGARIHRPICVAGHNISIRRHIFGEFLQ